MPLLTTKVITQKKAAPNGAAFFKVTDFFY